MTLSGVAVRRPVLAAVASSLIAVFGLFAFFGLPVRELPDVDRPVVSIDTRYVGASAEVVENQITQVIEDRLSGIQGIRLINSDSRDGRSAITIEFELSREIEAAVNDVRDAVSRVLDQLPEDAEAPDVEKADPDARPMMWLGLTSSERSILELSDFGRRNIVDQLSVVDGVARIVVGGGLDYAMRIDLDRRALAARGLTVVDIERALTEENVELPAGEIESTQTDLTLRVERAYQRAEEFAKLPIGESPDGHVVRLGEVAEVYLGPEDRRALFRGNGQPRVGIGVVRQSQANTVAVGAAVRAKVAEINRSLPDDVELVPAFDGSVFVAEALGEVRVSLAVAFVLVVAIIYLFLGSLRAAFVPALVVPVALVGTFIVLAAFGLSVNILTLLGLVLAIGLVVDDAIVVLENIQTRVDSGEPRLIAADRGAGQVFFAVIATTAVVVAVFSPLVFMDGFLGRLFFELAVTVCAAVIISSFVALTLTPMMASKLLVPAKDKGVPARWVDAAMGAAKGLYVAGLEPLLGRVGLLAAGALIAVALAASWWLAGQLPGELTPSEDRGAFRVGYQTPPGAGFDYTAENADAVEAVLLRLVEQGEVNTALVRVPGFGGTGFNSGIAIVVLAPWDERTRSGQEILAQVNRELGQLPGVRAFAGMRSPLGGAQNANDIQFVLQGSDYADLDAAAEALIAAMDGNPDLTRPRKSFEPTSPRLVVETDQDRAADLGVSARVIGAALATQFGSRQVTTFVSGGEEYNVVVQNRREDRRDPLDLSNTFVASAESGQLIALSNLVTLREEGDAPSRERVNRLRAVEISATLAEGYPMDAAIAWFEETALQVAPPDAQWTFLGAARDFAEAQNAVLITFVLALLIVFLVLAAQFESVISPAIIMLTVPLAVTGGLFGLYMAGVSLNIYSQIGLIILIGLAAKNAILLVEFANQRRDHGDDVRVAVLTAAGARFRPIIMTGLSTTIGALPLVLTSGAGAESRQAIGWVIVSGVLTATIFTLVVAPVMYAWLARFSRPPGALERELDALERAQPAE